VPTPAETTGLILAGGGSRRFGRDKALADVSGVSFVERVAWALDPLVCETLIATGPTHRLYPVRARVVLDPVPDGGPLAGLVAGLRAATTPFLLAVAVDLPGLTAEALAALVAEMPAGIDAAVAVDAAGRLHPVCALWRVATVEPVASAHLADGVLALHTLVERLAVRRVRLASDVLRNVNAPRDMV
jgi:molybdopterin-guanine dinucleotide biosynthesis protein A